MNSKNNWPFSKKIVFSIITLIFFVVFLEGATLLYTTTKAAILTKMHKIPAWMGTGLPDSYALLKYRFIAYSQARFCSLRNESIRINSLGFRGKEFSITKDKNVYRIIILGGSTAFSKGASSDRTTIAGYLEKILNDKIKEKHFEVYNMAISGYISAQELITLQFCGIDFKPDLVIDINGWNDISTGMHDVNYPTYASDISEPIIEAYHTLWEGPFYSIALVVLERWSYFVKHLSAKMKVEHNKRCFTNPVIKEKLIASRTPRVEFYIKNMNTLYALAEYYKFNLVVVLQPTLVYKSPLTGEEQKILQSYYESRDIKQLFPYIITKYYPEISEKMNGLKNNRQHFFLDFSPLFNNTKERVFIDIVHYNDKGNEIFAEKLYEKISPIITKNTD